MILPGFPVLLAAKSSPSIVFPAVTVGRADIGGGGALFGYVRPGGLYASFLGASGGTLSATLVPGFVTDTVFSNGEAITVVLVGDCMGIVSGVTALMDNGTPLPLLAPAEYDSGSGLTFIAFTGSWTSTGNRTVQLV